MGALVERVHLEAGGREAAGGVLVAAAVLTTTMQQRYDRPGRALG